MSYKLLRVKHPSQSARRAVPALCASSGMHALPRQRCLAASPGSVQTRRDPGASWPAKIAKTLRQHFQPAHQPSPYCLRGNAQHCGGLRLCHSLNPDQVERFAFLGGKRINAVDDAATDWRNAGAAVGRKRNLFIEQFRRAWLFIQTTGQVIQLPAHMLARSREKLPYGSGTDFAKSLE